MIKSRVHFGRTTSCYCLTACHPSMLQPHLKEVVEGLVRESHTMREMGSGGMQKAELIRHLGRELREDVNRQVQESLWRLISAPDSMFARQIEALTHEALCAVSQK